MHRGLGHVFLFFAAGSRHLEEGRALTAALVQKFLDLALELSDPLRLLLVSGSVLLDLVGVVLYDLELFLEVQLLLLGPQISQGLLIVRGGQLFLEHLDLVSETPELLILVLYVGVLHDSLSGSYPLLERESFPLDGR